MPKVQADWDQVAAGELIPEGKYAARIDAVEERVSRSSEKPYWNTTFTIIEPPFEGRKVWGIFMLEANALWKLRQLCEALDIDLEGRSDLDTDELLHGELVINVTQDVYEGKVRNQVSGFSSID